ncbi:dTDP-4-dehydrorhamnose 3,5-epimerase [Marinoscillum pacificum]|uniref:dTDP-4-dehydrorhamnose 3,5-epimerase n=1 Tax=Marinoscillum pacificum TaxID=392723 RepID=UPI0021576F11|nr:dTDP-4-dehydrorhamnose 3,5-epimerase [Marinoscillum pacificum]
MEVIETPLKDCVIIKSKMFGDDRGFFMESFNQRELEKHGIYFDVKQINFAKSGKNVLRGLHFQKEPHAQTKLVGVIAGSVIDVVVDMRKDSPTFKESFKLEIDARDTFLLIPKGFAHGYYTLEENTVFYYAVDNFYNAEAESGLIYNDSQLNIDWGLIGLPLVSEKDLKQPAVDAAYTF